MAWNPISKKSIRTIPLADGWSGGTCTIVTARDTVTAHLENLQRDDTPSGWVDVATLPTDARPAANVYGKSMRGADFRITSQGIAQMANPVKILDYATLTFTR